MLWKDLKVLIAKEYWFTPLSLFPTHCKPIVDREEAY